MDSIPLPLAIAILTPYLYVVDLEYELVIHTRMSNVLPSTALVLLVVVLLDSARCVPAAVTAYPVVGAVCVSVARHCRWIE